MSTSITKQGILRAPTASSGIGRSIRYLRDTTSGSTANAFNHWCEIQAYDSNGVNAAQGKTVVINGTEYANSIVTDGIINTSYIPSGMSGTVTATIDLGTVTNITRIKIWHYYPDGRTYYNNITEVSEDGTNWDVVYVGQKPETEGGNEIFLYPKVVNGNANENLIKNTTITTTAMGWAKAGTSVTTITISSDGVTTFSNTESTALQYARMCQWIDDGAWSTVNGKTITVSFDIYSDDWDSVHEVNGANSGFAGFAIQICRSTAAPGSGSTQQQQYKFARLNDTTFWNVPTKENGKWIHFVSKPFVINEENLNSSTSLTSGNYIHIGWQLRMQGVVKVKNLKVEYGSTATPWIPAPSDDIYVGDHGFFEGSDKGSIGKGYMEGNEFYEI